MSSDNLFVLLFALGVGLSAALVAWLLSHAFASVPTENREYKDPPPWGFRLVWWPVQALSHYLNPWIGDRTRERLAIRLRQADLQYALNAAQYLAGRMVCAGLLGLAFVLVAQGLTSRLGGSTSASFFEVGFVGLLLGWAYPAVWLKDRLALRQRELLKSLPFYMDIITLCVEGGLNFQGAIQQCVSKGPPGVLRTEFQALLRDIRAGMPRAEALRALASRLSEPSVTNFVSSVIQAETMGMNLGPVLRAQADQRRSERFLRAEKLAMQAPVKLLFPLIAFIFPCTFVVLFFPIAIKFLESGF